MGFSRQEYWRRLPFPSPGDLLDPVSKLWLLPCLLHCRQILYCLADNFPNSGIIQFSSVQLLSCVQFFATPWTAACQAFLSFTNSQSLLKFMSIESVMPSNHLILCCPLLLPPSIFPSIKVFSHESVLRIRGPKYWSLSFNISPSMNIQD